MENSNTESHYRWYVLALAAFTLAFCMGMPQICMPVLFNEISADLGLNLVQIGWIWGFYSLSSFFTVFMAGLLTDRFGARRMLVFACTIVGLAGASRGLAYDFKSLLITAFLFGLTVGLIPTNIFKVPATWFPYRQLGLANGILSTGMGVGFTLSSMFSATLLSPLLGGWRGVLFFYGGVSLFFAFLWFITVREQAQAGESDIADWARPREATSRVLRNKQVWLISLAMLGYTGCIQGMNGYLPLYLREFKGWLPASADGTLATFTGVSTLGAIPMTMLSDKLGRRKLFILFTAVLAITGVGFLSIADGIMIWLLVILIGIGRDGLMALMTAITIENKGIGALYSGTAIGLIHTVSRLGPFISPPLGNSLAKTSAGLPFIIWAAFGVLALICFSLIRETGHIPEASPGRG